jgi:hypothetical protein
MLECFLSPRVTASEQILHIAVILYFSVYASKGFLISLPIPNYFIGANDQMCIDNE